MLAPMVSSQQLLLALQTKQFNKKEVGNCPGSGNPQDMRRRRKNEHEYTLTGVSNQNSLGSIFLFVCLMFFFGSVCLFKLLFKCEIPCKFIHLNTWYLDGSPVQEGCVYFRKWGVAGGMAQ